MYNLCTKMGRDQFSQDTSTAFNMGLATLERINNLMISLASYNIENNITGMKNTIHELYKEASVYMNKDQDKEAEERWIEIENYQIVAVDSTSVKYNPDMVLLINSFDFWLRKIFHTKGILMPKSDSVKGFSKLKKAYKL